MTVRAEVLPGTRTLDVRRGLQGAARAPRGQALQDAAVRAIQRMRWTYLKVMRALKKIARELEEEAAEG
jgi:hypothetical protein